MGSIELAHGGDETSAVQDAHATPLAIPRRWLIAGVGALLVLVVLVASARQTRRDGADSFSRRDNQTTLGASSNGQLVWRADAGVWGISGGEAWVPGPAEGRNLAVVDLGTVPAALQARVARMASGAGLVFRYRDPANYWAVVAVPGYATWAVVKVVAGHERVVTNTGLSPTADGTALTVILRDDGVGVIVDGDVRENVSDPELADAAMVGMTTAGPEANVARFDDFRVSFRR